MIIHQKNKEQARLFRRAYKKFQEINEIIIPEYNKEKDNFFELNEKTWREGKEVQNLTEEAKRKLFQEDYEKRGRCINRLSFFYQDFFIHATICITDVCEWVTKKAGLKISNKMGLWGKITNFCQKNKNLKECKTILKFKPELDKIRYWRDKFFIHSEIIHPFGGMMRCNKEKKEIEFIAHDWLIEKEQKDILFMYQLRDKLKFIDPKFAKEDNFLELLSIFDKFSASLDKSDHNKIHEIKKQYGAILPKIEELMQVFQEFIKEIGLVTDSNITISFKTDKVMT